MTRMNDRRWPHSVILEKEGPNDGLVSVESAKWASWLLMGLGYVCVVLMLDLFL
jgi:hypothetical protein